MLKRIVAIAFIFVCTGIAWAILGSTIFSRTYDYQGSLEQRVASTWGTAQQQKSPSACYYEVVTSTETAVDDRGKAVKITKKPEAVARALPLESSRVNVAFDLEHRQKGLLWYATYKVAFAGDYVFRNNTLKEQNVTLRLAFPVAQAVYDDLEFAIDGKFPARARAARRPRPFQLRLDRARLFTWATAPRGSIRGATTSALR
jgi:hypothetical protein